MGRVDRIACPQPIAASTRRRPRAVAPGVIAYVMSSYGARAFPPAEFTIGGGYPPLGGLRGRSGESVRALRLAEAHRPRNAEPGR